MPPSCRADDSAAGPWSCAVRTAALRCAGDAAAGRCLPSEWILLRRAVTRRNNIIAIIILYYCAVLPILLSELSSFGVDTILYYIILYCAVLSVVLSLGRADGAAAGRGCCAVRVLVPGVLEIAILQLLEFRIFYHARGAVAVPRECWCRRCLCTEYTEYK